MKLQIAKWGNSLALRIPADVARQFDLHEGDTVDARLTARRRAEHPAGKLEPSRVCV